MAGGLADESLGDGAGLARPRRLRPRTRRGSAPGFTLIEAALATIIIGVGVLAMIDAQRAFLRSNLWSSHAAEGAYLANEIRELTRGLPPHDPVLGLEVDPGGEVVNWGPESSSQTVADFNDLDDFDGISFSWIGTPGNADGDLPGPIDAFGNVIPNHSVDGEITMDEDGADEPLQGWEQIVVVEKVNPFDTSQVVADGAFEEPSGGFKGRAVDAYPLRVTVEVRYTPPNDIESESIARVVWIVPSAW